MLTSRASRSWRARAAFALCCGVLPWLPSAAAERPPSSIAPEARNRPVLVSYRHTEVASCERVREPALHCQASAAARPRGTRASLRRLTEPSTTAEPNASVRPVVFEPGGPSEQTLELVPGTWQLEWPGFEGPRRFALTASNSPRLALTTVRGACELRNDSCVRTVELRRAVAIVEGAP